MFWLGAGGLLLQTRELWVLALDLPWQLFSVSLSVNGYLSGEPNGLNNSLSQLMLATKITLMGTGRPSPFFMKEMGYDCGCHYGAHATAAKWLDLQQWQRKWTWSGNPQYGYLPPLSPQYYSAFWHFHNKTARNGLKSAISKSWFMFPVFTFHLCFDVTCKILSVLDYLITCSFFLQ